MKNGRIAKTPLTKDFKFVKIKIHLKRDSLNWNLSWNIPCLETLPREVLPRFRNKKKYKEIQTTVIEGARLHRELVTEIFCRPAKCKSLGVMGAYIKVLETRWIQEECNRV